MGLLRRLFGPANQRGLIIGDGQFKFAIIGTSDHQEELESVCGGHYRTDAQKYFAALLAPQFNVDETYAVAVIIRDAKVGLLHPDDAHEFRRALRSGGFADAACEAMIATGWGAKMTRVISTYV